MSTERHIQPTNNLDTLLQWKGRTETVTDVVSTAWCRKLQETLDHPATLSDGDVLPPLWHFITHLGSVPLRALGRDGHPERGGFHPPVALPRRMWASGRFTFSGDIHLGEEVTKTSSITEIALKSGRSGDLCFVTVQHELTVEGDLRVLEEQDLVYRGDPAPGAPNANPAPAPTRSDFSRTITPSEVMLFRYSALTFNSHRIHYDRDYSRDVEGYPSLVVHGPLTATLLADLATSETGRSLASFAFRAMSPLFDTESFTIAGSVDGNNAELWASTPAGGLAMKASAVLRSN